MLYYRQSEVLNRHGSPDPRRLKEAAMREKQKLRRILRNILFGMMVLAAAAVLWVYQVWRQGSVEAESLERMLPEEEPLPTVTITDEELNQLIRGEMLLDELPVELPEDSAAEEEASGEEAGEETGEQTGEVPSGQETPAPAASSGAAAAASAASSGAVPAVASGSSHTGGASAAAAPSDTTQSSSVPVQEAAWEAEIRELLVQVYAVKARAENGLNACIESAKAEFHALPENKQTQTRKVTISLAKAGELSALQSSCDNDMDRIVGQMRRVLQENGQSTALADQVMETYKKEKSTRMETLKNKLYGG